MKNISILFLAVLFWGNPLFASAALTDSLQGYWKLDEFSDGSGAVARMDSTVNTNDLTDVNTTAGGTGIISNGADFEITNNEYLTITDVAQTGLDITENIAVSFWFKPESQPATDDLFEFITKFNTGLGGHAYRFLYQDDAGVKKLSMQLYDSDNPSINVGFKINQTLNNGTLYHIVFSYDISANTLTAYVNGSSIGTTTGEGIVDVINNSAGNFSIGVLGTGTQGWTDGIIDEVGIWDRKLTGAEVAELYNGGSGFAYPFIIPNPSITGFGTSNRIAKFITGNTVGDSLLSDDGFNTILTSGNFFMSGSSLFDTIINGAINFGTTMATTMTFGRSGQDLIINSKVGIGTLVPSSLLHVQGDLKVGTISTLFNCVSVVSPAICGSASAGSVAMSNGRDTLVVNTTAVTANSQIMITEDSSLGARLGGITCNTGTNRTYRVSARSTTTPSFTIKSSNNPVTNKACLSYWIIN